MAKITSIKTSHEPKWHRVCERVRWNAQTPPAKPVVKATTAMLKFKPPNANPRQIAVTTLAPVAVSIPAASLSPLTEWLRLMP
jgi:hypothetical protein